MCRTSFWYRALDSPPPFALSVRTPSCLNSGAMNGIWKGCCCCCSCIIGATDESERVTKSHTKSIKWFGTFLTESAKIWKSLSCSIQAIRSPSGERLLERKFPTRSMMYTCTGLGLKAILSCSLLNLALGSATLSAPWSFQVTIEPFKKPAASAAFLFSTLCPSHFPRQYEISAVVPQHSEKSLGEQMKHSQRILIYCQESITLYCKLPSISGVHFT